MGRFLLRRLIQSAVALLGTITLVFFIQRLAGDPTLLMLPEGATREDIATLRHQLGFDRPLVALYGPTRVERVGPYGRSAHVVQRLIPGDSRDHKDAAAGQVLMRRIGVEDVLELARSQMGPVVA